MSLCHRKASNGCVLNNVSITKNDVLEGIEVLSEEGKFLGEVLAQLLHGDLLLHFSHLHVGGESVAHAASHRL